VMANSSVDALREQLFATVVLNTARTIWCDLLSQCRASMPTSRTLVQMLGPPSQEWRQTIVDKLDCFSFPSMKHELSDLAALEKELSVEAQAQAHGESTQWHELSQQLVAMREHLNIVRLQALRASVDDVVVAQRDVLNPPGGTRHLAVLDRDSVPQTWVSTLLRDQLHMIQEPTKESRKEPKKESRKEPKKESRLTRLVQRSFQRITSQCLCEDVRRDSTVSRLLYQLIQIEQDASHNMTNLATMLRDNKNMNSFVPWDDVIDFLLSFQERVSLSSSAPANV